VVEPVEQQHALTPGVAVQLGGVGDWMGDVGPKGVDRPVDPGGGVQQPPGGRVVEERRAHRHQGAVAGLEALAVADPADPVERRPEVLAVDGIAAHREPGGHQGGVGARIYDLAQVAGVVVVVVGEEHPADIGRVDQVPGVLEPLLAIGGGAGVDQHRLGPGDH
jgi:hypothetical protein